MKFRNSSKLALSLLVSLNAVASPQDVFFAKEGSRFIKNDVVDDLGAPSKRYSACQVGTDGKAARCTDLGIVHLDQFAKMRDCEGTKRFLDAVETLGGGAATVFTGILTIAAVAGPGTQAMTPGLAFYTAASAATATHGVHSFLKSGRKVTVYSEETEQGLDSLVGMSYEKYVDALSESFDNARFACNVAGDTAQVDPTPYTVTLSGEQIRMLRRAKAK